MKKILLLSLLSIISMELFCFDFMTVSDETQLEITGSKIPSPCYFYYCDDEVYLLAQYANGLVKFVPENFPQYIIPYNQQIDGGWVFFEDTHYGSPALPRKYLLKGSSIFIPYPGSDSLSQKASLPYPLDEQIRNWNIKKNDARNRGSTRMKWCDIYLYDDGITSISSSSHLTEGNIVYGADNLRNKIYIEYGDDPFRWDYDSITPPWVEGVPGYGIGEWLDVTFKYESDQIQILNGFVDFRRKYLFQDNSRIKTVLIESESPAFSQEYELLDVVQYSVINLPTKTDHIRITIKDVYPGTKYEDTCISSILVTNPTLISYEEQKSHIEQILVENDIMDLINEKKEVFRNSAQ